MSEVDRPWQFLPSAEISNPALQTQWKLPSVFTQRPLLQIRPLATHSSRSGRNKQIKHSKHIHPLKVWVYMSVYVYAYVTSALCPGCSSLESSRTLTDVRPFGVHTFSMCTRVSLTFISIWRTNIKFKNVLHLQFNAQELVPHHVKNLPMHSPLPSKRKPMLHSQRYPMTGTGIHLPFRQRLR